ncbi:MAG TPA: M14 family zinc carboxypeptidase [Candidatus Krumholzibacteria bacterium]|nr:M14 family zinc carboxypeptidase [Candidatus Krumholzibacteria bacterium]HPD72469.1 M14 family zinc carboxypeptidase [Candidatus Krumholzibacteria bacterium]HRY40599.1 M14 family zinc carboxypeptidase [Candidatus Krumholzibacteria bacterium]
MQRFPLRAAALLALTLVVLPVHSTAADDPAIPLDSDGLPAWSVKVWTDFPVRIVLADRAALDALLDRVGIADVQREQVRPEFAGGKVARIVFEPRVTEAEFAALVNAGYRPERLPDLDREGRTESELLWRQMARGKSEGLRTDPLNYVPTNDQINTMLHGIATAYPSLARYFSWGSSIQGRTIHGLVISDNVQLNEPEPQVRYSSSMHGDEITGMVLCLDLAYYLVEHYGQAGYENVTDLVDNYELHLVPAYNPDGTYLNQRYNANGVDLNRNFLEPAGTHLVLEQENVLFSNYTNANHFVISINYHGGSLVMNYPWDYTYALTPDDAAIQLLALEYSTRNLPMYNGAFPQGITNGAQWYVITGSLQDWCYDQTDCVDITCEVSNTKWPSGSLLPGFWNDNRESMIAYARSARWGVTGVVTSATTGEPLAATVTVVGNAKTTHTDPANGDYYKLLPDGTFSLTFEATGYVTQTVAGVVNVWGIENVVDVQMQPLAEGHVSGTVTDPQGQGLDAFIEIRTWPGDELVDSITSDGANGGAFSVDLFYGDYTFTASAVDHFTESQQVTVSAAPAVVEFVLGGMTTSYPVDEDFEIGMGAFVGDWILATPGYNSTQCLTDSEGSYPNNATLLATMTTGVDLAAVMEPQVSFFAKWSIENSWDAVFFEVSTDGGTSWTAVEVPGRTNAASGQGTQRPAGTPCFDGTQASWVTCAVDLTPFIGEADVRFRFRLATDSSQVYDGFYLDDFKVRITTEGGTTPVDSVPDVIASVRAYPNPFNPTTTFRLANPRDGQVALAVYDLQGRLVRDLYRGELERGEHEVRWDGSTDQGFRAGSGVYVARMAAAGATAAVKVMLVK